jgi:hypothetical protein
MLHMQLAMPNCYLLLLVLCLYEQLLVAKDLISTLSKKLGAPEGEQFEVCIYPYTV